MTYQHFSSMGSDPMEDAKVDIESQEADIESPKVDIESPKTDIEDQKADIEDQKVDIESPKVDVERYLSQMQTMSYLHFSAMGSDPMESVRKRV